jgi:hypothetical protein
LHPGERKGKRLDDIPCLDTDKPNVARFCDRLLGGRDDIAANR